MQFNKSRVYTAQNADELEVGSMVIVANNLKTLKENVAHSDYEGMVRRLMKINDEYYSYRFAINKTEKYALAYLISLPKKPRYKPFSNSKAAYEAIAAHGGWIKEGCTYHFIIWIDIGRADKNEIFFYGNWHSAQSICEKCTFADDGTPVGEKIEDSDTEEDGAH